MAPARFVLAVLSASALFDAAAAQAIPSDKLLAGTGSSSDKFGYAVDVDGDTLVAGSIYADTGAPDSGSAYVFERSSGVWSEVLELVPENPETFTDFGWSVAVDGDTIAVGRRADNQDGLFGSGSVYVYVRNGSTWSFQQKLRASDPGSPDQFGTSVGLDGDTLVVGARRDDSETGSAYVFTRAGAVWTQRAKLLASDGEAFDALGFSVALAGDTIVAGAIGDDDNGDRAGSAYVFVNGDWFDPGASVLNETAKLLAGDGQPLDNFGSGVAVQPGRILVGCHADDDAGTDGGSAYFFEGAGASWSEVQKVVPAGGTVNAQFGNHVDLHGSFALIGASNEPATFSGQGAAYLYARFAGHWSLHTRVVAPDPGLVDSFGEGVAMSGGTLVVGAPNDDDLGNNSGSVYAFELKPLQPSSETHSLSAGGATIFALNAGKAHASLPYLLLGSASGTAPGIPFGGLVLPLNFDGYFLATLGAPNTPPLVDSLGLLDPNGLGLAAFFLPPGVSPSLAGLSLHHAYAVAVFVGPVPTPVFVSNPAPLVFAP